MRWVVHIARIGGMKVAYKFCSESLKERDHSEELGVDGRMVLKCCRERG
jgi:hypothetical protein